MEDLPAQPVHGIMNGFRVLQELTVLGKPVSGKELSVRLNVEVTKISRILKTLAYLGFAHRTGSRKYMAGPGLYGLATQALHESPLRHYAIEPLEALHIYGYTVHMGVLWREKILYLYRWQPGMPNNQTLGCAGMNSAEECSLGQIMLAQMDDEHILNLFQQSENREDGQRKEMIKLLHLTRGQGFGHHSCQQHRGLSVQVGNPAFAAIGLYGTIPETQINQLVLALKQTAVNIEKNMKL